MIYSYNKTVLFVCLFSLLCLAGCAHYNVRPLSYINYASNTKQKKQVLLTYRKFNKNDCKKYFDRDILSSGYQPMQIMIHNNTSRFLSFDLQRCNVPIIPPADIADEFHTSTATRCQCYGFASLFLWPFLIPAIIDGIASSKSNKKLDLDFSNKSLYNQTITPYSSINGVVFIPKDIHPKTEIIFTLIDQANSEPYVISTNKTIIPFEA